MGDMPDMTSLQTFITAVRESRVLSDDQKKELTDEPEMLPEQYRNQVIAMLKTFDEHSRFREDELHNKLAESFAAFEKELAASDMDEHEKTQLIHKAKEQIKEFFPQP